jgi:sugar phosphate isomerase/epimerase
MHLGIFAKTFAGDTPDAVLGAAKAAGYGAVQYNMACSGIGALPAVVSDAVADAVAAATKAHGVEIAAISATYNMIHPVMATRLAGRASFAAIAAQARRMGCDVLTVCTGSRDAEDQWRHDPSNQSPSAWAEMLEEFGHLIAIADQHNLQIGVEPELANVVDSAPAALRLIKALGSDRIRIVLDPANLVEEASAEDRREVIETAVDLLADRIVMAHAKDRHADGRFATAGKGVIDFRHFLFTLKQAGFYGPVVTHGLTAAEAPGVAAFLTKLGVTG